MKHQHKKITRMSRIKAFVAGNKISSVVIAIILLGAIYYAYGAFFDDNKTTQYVLTQTRKGTLEQTVTGSGQVSSINQLDIKSEVPGKITSIRASVGQYLKSGDIIAVIDSTTALRNLENAQIAYAKLVQPAKKADLDSAVNNLNRSYTEGFNAVASAMLDMPLIMDGLNNIFYTSDGFLNDQRLIALEANERAYGNIAGLNYDNVKKKYETMVLEYKSINRNSATSSIEMLIEHTYTMVKDVANILKDTQNAITFIITNKPDYYTQAAPTTSNNVISWSVKANGHVANILSSRDSISSSKDNLATLRDGADALDIKSQLLSLRTQEENYGKYFIRAPFDGVVGRIPVHTYDEASGAVIATMISEQKQVSVSLNEIDIVKVKKDDPVSLTFDAIPNISVPGNVAEMDLIGTASQGVVTYNVKIVFDGADNRVKPGMSADATIVTEEKYGVLLVPSSAIKTQGRAHYVEVPETVPSTLARKSSASSSPENNTSSPTPQNVFGKTTTISSNNPPTKITVTIGETDDTNTEITGGLQEGQWVVMRTIAASATSPTTAQTPNIFNSMTGGQRAIRPK